MSLAATVQAAVSYPSSPVTVPYAQSLVVATFVRRIDRFICECRLEDDTIERVHCVNSGRMEDFIRKGARIWLEPGKDNGEKRKSRFTWELLEYPVQLEDDNNNDDHDIMICGTNTQRPNKIMEEVIKARVLPGFDTWDSYQREVTLDESAEVNQGGKGRKGKKTSNTIVDFRLMEGRYPIHP